jgi:molecular chaperone GrpE
MSERPNQQIEEPAPAPGAGPPEGDGQEPVEGVLADAEQPAESELEATRRERDEYLDLAQRTRADLENYRRRVSADAGVAEQRGRATMARDLIPAIDDLERALLAVGVEPDSAVPEGEPPSEELSAQGALAEGVALVYRELRDGLRRGGVEAFDPAGEKFDPTTSEAVATADGDGAQQGIVIEVLERGYRIGDVVLRPARVVVGS